MNEPTFHLMILSPAKRLFDGEATRITLPGTLGEFTILAHHAPIVASLRKGKLTYVSAGSEQTLEIESGFIEMSSGTVSVCVS